MSVRFGQILILLFLLVLLFGDLPKLIRHLAKSVEEWKISFKEIKSDNEEQKEKSS